MIQQYQSLTSEWASITDRLIPHHLLAPLLDDGDLPAKASTVDYPPIFRDAFGRVTKINDQTSTQDDDFHILYDDLTGLSNDVA